jgi:hypothetical protein
MLVSYNAGLDYVMLALKGHGLIDKMTEKKYNRYLQQWVRAPSMSIYAFIAWTAWYNGNTDHFGLGM